MTWTPYLIEIVLHHHCSSAAFPRASAPAYAQAVSDLILDGILIDGEGGTITSTDLGKALVECWCSQPLPVATYVDPRLSSSQGRVE